MPAFTKPSAGTLRTFEPSAGRPMKEYVELPPPITKNPAVMQRWFERGRTYVATLPARKPKKK